MYAKQHFPVLDSLRGLVILLVVVFHYFGILNGSASDLGLATTAPLWLRWAASGNTGVTLFFVLSGFLLTSPFVYARRLGYVVNRANFYKARALRILPMYYCAVLVAWWVSCNTYSAVYSHKV